MVDNQMVSRVELFFSCRDLPRMDYLSKSDPQVYVFLKNTAQERNFNQIGSTEMILNNHDPDFQRSVSTYYIFEQVQELKFEIYDIDAVGKPLSDQDFIGIAQIQMGDLVAAPGQSKTIKLKKKDGSFYSHARIIVRCVEIKETQEWFTFQLVGQSLAKKRFFLA
eukprot:TRINITY_DN33718_c0_g1_i1.p1 TRINITY_DN33718_c0_g1~~TRINITY_DN33718_c0_g1_i1.p1  ORF type:complete len:165 (-),score=17.72 TRINITY_DN33718_c0_g1_i1:31-525(-)